MKKVNNKKLAWNLLPWRELEQVAEVFQKSNITGKHEPFDYQGENFDSASVYFSALIRHLFKACIKGITKDRDSRLLHLAHVVANALILLNLYNLGRSVIVNQRYIPRI